MWSSLIKYVLVAVYTPAICSLITDVYHQAKVPNIDLQLKKRFTHTVTYCKCGVCEQNRRLGLPLTH